MTGERIAFLRNRVGWSQSQLAKELHVSLKTVTNWERGDSDPSAKNIISLCEIFSVSADFLLGKSETPSIYIGSLCKKDQRDGSGVYKSINNKIRCDAVLACVAFV